MTNHRTEKKELVMMFKKALVRASDSGLMFYDADSLCFAIPEAALFWGKICRMIDDAFMNADRYNWQQVAIARRFFTEPYSKNALATWADPLGIDIDYATELLKKHSGWWGEKVVEIAIPDMRLKENKLPRTETAEAVLSIVSDMTKCTSKEIVGKTGFAYHVVSSRLKQLEREGVISSRKMDGCSEKIYFLQEEMVA